jgi:hypothetical protein
MKEETVLPAWLKFVCKGSLYVITASIMITLTAFVVGLSIDGILTIWHWFF